MPAPPLLVIVGPTASGKSDLALRVAEQTAGEIVNADSVQVYTGFDIGAGKPAREDLSRIPHHLLGTVDPSQALDAARWAESASACIVDIEQRGKRPIVCGGSFLWVRALLFGLSPAPPADEAVRARHRELVSREGAASLHASLAAVDPESARKLSANDVVRVSRALEVFELSRKPLSAWHAEHGFRTARFDARLVGIRYEPQTLDERIRRRTRGMLERGLVEEVRSLLERGYGGTRAMGAVGYRQVAAHLNRGGAIDLALLEEEIVRATRIFARRQRTWLRDEPVRWLTPEEASEAMDV